MRVVVGWKGSDRRAAIASEMGQVRDGVECDFAGVMPAVLGGKPLRVSHVIMDGVGFESLNGQSELKAADVERLTDRCMHIAPPSSQSM
jgi:hypothetical protein